MGSGRWMLPAGALAIVACASIAGLEDGDPPRSGSSPTAPSGSTPSGTSGGQATSSGSTSGEAPPDGAAAPEVEAGPDGPVCGTPGQGCSKPEHCCNNVCREDRECAGSCKALGEVCVTTSDDCCIGAYCGTNLGCKKCIEPGGAAERVVGIPNAKSCCSRDVSVVGNCK